MSIVETGKSFGTTASILLLADRSAGTSRNTPSAQIRRDAPWRLSPVITRVSSGNVISEIIEMAGAPDDTSLAMTGIAVPPGEGAPAGALGTSFGRGRSA
jgi:hypothetical protein